MSNKDVSRLWGTAFSKDPKEEVVAFCSGRDTASLPSADDQLLPFEITASKAYVHGLYEKKLIDAEVFDKLLSGLGTLLKLYQEGKFKVDEKYEDVHSAVESWLTQTYGIDIAGRIHTGRSRNEQIAVDMLLYMQEKCDLLISQIKELEKELTQKSIQYEAVLLPGYTHHQHATVTTFGAILSAFAFECKKDYELFEFWKTFALISPLGSAAGYGTTLPIDKYAINAHLGFKKVFANPTQAITFKDDAATLFVFAISMLMNHLSTLAQTLMLFSTKEFGFITLSDEYTTGSSIMPQKKNPDPLEVTKAKAAVCQGYLVSLLSLSKATFIGYNRDSQWGKYLVMDAVRESLQAPVIMAGIIKTLTIHNHKMMTQLKSGFIFSQAIMEGLIKDYSLPMRVAKIAVETAVKESNPTDGITCKILNSALSKIGKEISVNPEIFQIWIDPLKIVKLQNKK